jgi:hypothetical protein
MFLRPNGLASGTAQATYDTSGNFTAAANVTAFSDFNLKENIEKIHGALMKIDLINGYTFTRNDLEDKERRYTGVIAQEIQEVLPEVVNISEEGILSVAYGNMAGLFIEAIKELKAEIETLKSKIGAE